MVGSAQSPEKLTPDERKFWADAFVASLASVLMRYDGAFADRAAGCAHLAAEQANASLAEYRGVVKGGVA